MIEDLIKEASQLLKDSKELQEVNNLRTYDVLIFSLALTERKSYLETIKTIKSQVSTDLILEAIRKKRLFIVSSSVKGLLTCFDTGEKNHLDDFFDIDSIEMLVRLIKEAFEPKEHQPLPSPYNFVVAIPPIQLCNLSANAPF
jgi:hypothetical protein